MFAEPTDIYRYTRASNTTVNLKKQQFYDPIIQGPAPLQNSNLKSSLLEDVLFPYQETKVYLKKIIWVKQIAKQMEKNRNAPPSPHYRLSGRFLTHPYTIRIETPHCPLN